MQLLVRWVVEAALDWRLVSRHHCGDCRRRAVRETQYTIAHWAKVQMHPS